MPPSRYAPTSDRRTACRYPKSRTWFPRSGACTATYRTVNSWSGGFQGEVTVRAGSSAVKGWTVRWTLSGGQCISQVWNGLLTASGSAVSIRNESYNGSLPGSGSTTFGFLASGTATNPTLSCSSP